MRRFLLFIVTLFIVSCKSGQDPTEENLPESRVPVTVTNITIGKITDIVALNATSSFLLKTYVKATTNGYLQEVNIKLGDRVLKGQKLFTIRSKESEYLGNIVNKVDSSLRFSGLNSLTSPSNGYITQLTYQPGNYVQDSETLAAISDINSLVFLLDLPYELKPCLTYNKTIDLLLPDGAELKGTIESSLPLVDPISQTQSYIIRVSSTQPIPENLNAIVNFIRKVKTNAVSLPKDAILANELQNEFWIMKMSDSITAIKVPITKGIETSDRIEILSPTLTLTDKILVSGNYGLPDTVQVSIENKMK